DSFAGIKDVEATLFRFRANCPAEIRTQIAEGSGFARVDVFRDAAGKKNPVYSRHLAPCRCDIKLAPWLPPHRYRIEENTRHSAREPRAHFLGQVGADIEIFTEVAEKSPSGFLQADYFITAIVR